MSITLRKLRYFVAAAESGSVTGAATSLNVSQPSISIAIAELEQDLGGQLFIRLHSKGMTLAPIGRKLLQQARDVLARADDLVATVRADSHELRGSIFVGCLSNLSSRYFGDIARRFALRHPEIQLRLRDADQEALLELLAAGEIEVAITYNVLSEDKLVLTDLLEVTPYVIVHDKHRLRNRVSVHLSELANEPCILLDLPISRRYFSALFEMLSFKPQLRYSVRSIETVRSLVANGLGYSVLTSPISSGATYDGRRIVTLPLSDPILKPKIVCVQDAGLAARPAVRTFVEFLTDYFGSLNTSVGSRRARPSARFRPATGGLSRRS